jgi:F-type H+-transporting ATPase subunit a
MHLSSDDLIFWQHGWLKLNETIVTTWALMFVLAMGAKLITRELVTGIQISRWQAALEIIVTGIEKQIEEVGLWQPEKYIGFIGTCFCSSRRPIFLRFFRFTNHRPVRSRRQRLWP